MDRMESELVLIIGQPAGRTLYSRWRVSVWFCLGMIGWFHFFQTNLKICLLYRISFWFVYGSQNILFLFFFFCGALVSGILDRYSLF
jgi:hypothetical protein